MLPAVTSSPLATETPQPSSQTNIIVLPAVTSSSQPTETPQLFDLTSSEAFKQTLDLSRTLQVTRTVGAHSSRLLSSSLSTQLQTTVTQSPDLVTMETTIVPSTTLLPSPTTSTTFSSTTPPLLPSTASVQVFSSPSFSLTPPPTMPTTSYDVSCMLLNVAQKVTVS